MVVTPYSTGVENTELSLIKQFLFFFFFPSGGPNSQAIGNSPSISKNRTKFIKRDVASSYENSLEFYLLVEQLCPFCVCIAAVEVRSYAAQQTLLDFSLARPLVNWAQALKRTSVN